MLYSKKNYANSCTKEFRIYGCKKPSAGEEHPQIFVSTVFAPNQVVAQSKFFKITNKQYKIKATNGVIVRIEEVEQDNDYVIKNYGIKFSYRTRSGLLNGYKEIRHINRALAVAGLCSEFGSRHKIKSSDIYIIDIKQLADDEVTKSKILSYVGKDVRFPIFNKESNTEAEVVPVSVDIFN